MVVASQTEDITPADKKIYAQRDTTATVSSIPLIASSIMSKKLASGAPNIVLDVTIGSGAFMKSVEEGKLLADKMVTIGKSCGRNVSAVLTNMDEPLGFAVGNAIEVEESVRPVSYTHLDVYKRQDIAMAFDECVEIPSPYKYCKDSCDRTYRLSRIHI